MVVIRVHITKTLGQKLLLGSVKVVSSSCCCSFLCNSAIGAGAFLLLLITAILLARGGHCSERLTRPKIEGSTLMFLAVSATWSDTIECYGTSARSELV